MNPTIPDCAIAEFAVLRDADPGAFGEAELADIDRADWYDASNPGSRYTVLLIDTTDLPWWPGDVGPAALRAAEIDPNKAEYCKVDHCLHRWSVADGFYHA